ncbi:hypothetical protein [Lysinibacillus odysseyi]|uniref:hypothetical protein n=1 Tax=Lysinibacillus odysseyi TaxID=202611 RepID=UPI000A9D613E|nr:hypothetical protein [Lysinibacillus odysseyi]
MRKINNDHSYLLNAGSPDIIAAHLYFVFLRLDKAGKQAVPAYRSIIENKQVF